MSYTAHINLSQHGEYFHVYSRIAGDTHQDALTGANDVLNLFAKGREAFIRTKPEAVSETDFDTKEELHKGFVRFSLRDRPGDWHYPKMDDGAVITGFGVVAV